MKHLIRGFIALLAFAFSAESAPIRIAFLRDDHVLDETLGILRTNGCDPDALQSFRKAVAFYNKRPLNLNTAGFPPLTNGFFSFASGSDAVHALPHRLSDTPHDSEINCFDTTIMITKGLLQNSLRPDESAGPFLWFDSGQERQPTLSTTPRKTFDLMYPESYQAIVKSIVPEAITDRRVCLTVMFSPCGLLSPPATGKDLANTSLKV